MREIWQKTPFWLKTAAAVVLAGGLFFVFSGVELFQGVLAPPPEEFLTAYREGADISQKIVSLTAETSREIKEINSLDLSGDIDGALVLIEQTANKNQETYREAVKLSDKMRQMAETLNKISLPEGQRFAVKAISAELSLIGNFIGYTQTMHQFLGNLYKAIATTKKEYRQAAENNLAELNAKTYAINNLNRQFLEAMDDFNKTFSDLTKNR